MTKAEFITRTKERFPDTDAHFEYFMYKIRFAEQIALDPHVPLAKGLKILILSDRCPDRAFGLQEYLREKTDVSEVILLHESDSVRDKLEKWVPDILIFVGYQKNALNYKARDLVLLKNPSALVVMFAYLDQLIKGECISNRISYSFSSHKPLADFVEYFSAICAEETVPQSCERANNNAFIEEGASKDQIDFEKAGEYMGLLLRCFTSNNNNILGGQR